jgi:uncharacterized protein (DUF1800 family)
MVENFRQVPSPAEISYLWRRAGLGISGAGAAARTSWTWTQLVDELVDPPAVPLPRPASFDDPRASSADREKDLTVSWLCHMATTPAPGAEKLAWFFHNHFSCSIRKYVHPHLALRQLGALQAGSQGPFRTLLESVVLDSAMLLFLDNHLNTTGRTNENLARELLEVFTVGTGSFTQADVADVARSLTGRTIAWEDPALPATFAPHLHDHGTKTVLGRTGAFDGPGVLDVLCGDAGRWPLARRLATRLWTQWAYPRPSTAVVDEIALRFLGGGATGRALMRAVLQHPAFRSEEARSALPCTPVEVAVALHRNCELPRTNVDVHHYPALRAAGHLPFDPPNVGGWPDARGLWNPMSWWTMASIHTYAMVHLRDQGVPWYAQIKGMEPFAAATAMLRRLGIAAPTDETVFAVTAGIVARHATDQWGLDHAVFLAAALAPDTLAPV